MMMFADSVCGYCVIERLKIARMPSTRMNRLMTTARTGRRMKRSVSFIERLVFLRGGIRVIAGLDRVVDRDGRAVLDFQLACRDDDIALLHAGQRLHLI